MIDLTKIGQPKQASPSTPPIRNVRTSENLKVPQTKAAKSFRKRHWTPDKFMQDGQIRAGKVDKKHKEFLKKTTWVE